MDNDIAVKIYSSFRITLLNMNYYTLAMILDLWL